MNRILTMASVAALGLTVAACGGGGNSSAETAATDNAGMISNEVVMSDEMSANSAGADNGSAVAPAGALTGQAFADAAAKSDAFEIAAAKLAQANGQAKAVKDYAATMIKAHTDSTAKIKAASAKASPAITPDPTLTPDQQAKIDALTPLKGAEFDKAYAAGQVAAHQETLATMQAYAAGGDVPSLKTTAGEIAPVVQGHLEMAQKLPM